jgi:tricorn protease
VSTKLLRRHTLRVGILIAVIAFASLLVVNFSTRVDAQNGAGGGTRLLRTPTVSPTQIGFAYANNIWVVPRAGGSARRITSFQGQTANPHFSPDGKWIAFSGEYAGNFDAYVVASEGGEPRRLTWHPGSDMVEGWTPDGKSVLFSSTRGTWAPSGAPRFWTVPVSGGVEEPMPLPRAYQGKISADGTRIAYRMNNSWDEERRNYRGGQNRPIWIVDLKTYDLVSPPWTDSKDLDPVWLDDSVYFISDRDGISNVWEYQTKTKKLAQVTKFRDFDVKSMDSGAGTIVFEQAGYIHELDPKTGRQHVITISATGDFPWMMPNWDDVSNRITNMALSPTGRRVVVEARGEVFTIPSDKGDVRNLTNSSSSAERDPAWSPDGKFVSYFSDKSGEYKLVIESQDGLTPPREIALEKPTHYYTPSWSPDSKKLLFSDTNLNVWVLDVASGQAKVVGHDPWMVPQRTLNPVWSPDSKWVAYSSRLRSLYHAIFISNAETGESKQVTDGLADAVWPAWDSSGKYLWFLASTDFGLRSQWLDMTSYDREENFGLYLAVLKKSDSSPLLPESDEDRGIGTGTRRLPPGACAGDAPGGGGDAASAGAGDAAGPQTPRGPRGPVTVTVDFDGLAKRIIAVPGVPERQYSALHAGIDGQVFYLEAGRPAPGGGGGGGGQGNELLRYRLCDRRPTTFVSSVATFEVSADHRKLLYRAAGGGGFGQGQGAGGTPPAPQLFLVDSDRTPPQQGQGRLNF